jgi:two-component system nitrate/nitrite sensor histidine kinase NarQ
VIKQAEKSVTSTIAKAMLLIVLLSLITTSVALVTLASSLNDAEAVNVSGSMRMQSYRLSHDIQKQNADYARHIKEFEVSLYSPSMAALQGWLIPQDITQDYQNIITRWGELKLVLQSSDRVRYTDMVADYVSQIDQFVYKLQRYSEEKLIGLAWVGGIGLSGIFVVSIYVVSFIRRQIVKPLKSLLIASSRIQSGSFDVMLHTDSQNEMGILTNTFNSMARELGKLYRGMELAVNEKTIKLQRANQSLQVLYGASQELTASRIGKDNFIAIISNITQLDGVEAARLEVGISNEKNWLVEQGNIYDSDLETESMPLILDNQKLGELTIGFSHQNYDHALIGSFVQMLARAVFFNQAQIQAEQLLLMEERATIARELHDSLAQSLSYLKIQVSLLKRGMKALPELDSEQPIHSVISDIDKGLSDAYTQLRELLTTFRLTIREGNFAQALQVMISELSVQSSAEIELYNQLSSLTLDAHQQVHLLQLIREATLNAIKHAEASKIKIHCSETSEQLTVSVVDDGKGFCQAQSGINHYGMAIMQERAERLGGMLSIDSLPDHGCAITLVYNKNTQHGAA